MQKIVSQNISTFFWISLLIVYPLFFIFQGLDFTDQGYWLTGYQRIFEDPQSVTIMMPTWLSLVIGGLVDLTGYGVISFRIAFVVVVWITIYLTYRLLRECFDRRQILFPLFVTLVYINKWGVNWVSYNDLSALFFLVATIALWFGLQNKNAKWMLLSGAVIGLGVYLRIPNVTGIALIVPIFFAGWLYGWRIRFSIRFVLVLLMGIACGLLVGLLVMHLLGHLSYFFDILAILQNQVAQPGYHHSSSILLNLFIHDHIRALGYAFFVIVVIFVIAWVKKQQFNNESYRNKYCHLGMRLGGIAIAIILAIYLEQGLRYRCAMPGFCYAVLMLGLFIEIKRNNPSHALLYFIALILLLIVPLGSNNGIGNAIYGSWLALPLSIMIIMRLPEDHPSGSIYSGTFHNKNSLLKNKTLVLPITNVKEIRNFQKRFATTGFYKVIVGAILLFSGHLAYVSTYRDSEDRGALSYGVAVPELMYVLTSKERSKVVGELLVELNGIIKPGDYLLAVGDIPMLNYLTHTRPFLSSSWTGILSQEQLASDLIEVKKNGKILPVIVRTKGSVHNPEWPNVEINNNYHGDNEALIGEFMLNNGYRPKWENQWFEIWTSS